MPTITLKEGDFGADQEVSFGDEAMYLPDPDRPGLRLAVPLADVAEMDSLDSDSLGAVKAAVAKGAMGLLFGGPKMMADGFSSATRVKDVSFTAMLKDGRRFVATTDAKTYANLHAAQVAARGSALFADGGSSEADAIIAKYLDQAGSAADADRVRPEAPPPTEPPPEPAQRVERRSAERSPQPTFGRRRSD